MIKAFEVVVKLRIDGENEGDVMQNIGARLTRVFEVNGTQQERANLTEVTVRKAVRR